MVNGNLYSYGPLQFFENTQIYCLAEHNREFLYGFKFSLSLTGLLKKFF